MAPITLGIPVCLGMFLFFGLSKHIFVQISGFLFVFCVLLACWGYGGVLLYALNCLRHRLCSQRWPPITLVISVCWGMFFWLVFGSPLLFKSPVSCMFLCVLLACCGWGGCSHMFWIASGTGCAPKDGPITLRIPVCWGMFLWLLFWGPLCYNILGFFYICCLLLAGVGGCSHMFGIILKYYHICVCILIHFIVFSHLLSHIFCFLFLWRCRIHIHITSISISISTSHPCIHTSIYVQSHLCCQYRREGREVLCKHKQFYPCEFFWISLIWAIVLPRQERRHGGLGSLHAKCTSTCANHDLSWFGFVCIHIGAVKSGGGGVMAWLSACLFCSNVRFLVCFFCVACLLGLGEGAPICLELLEA